MLTPTLMASCVVWLIHMGCSSARMAVICSWLTRARLTCTSTHLTPATGTESENPWLRFGSWINPASHKGGTTLGKAAQRGWTLTSVRGFAVTCEFLPLAFFDTRAMLEGYPLDAHDHTLDLQHELMLMQEKDALLNEMLRSKSWRLTAPLRSLNSLCRRLFVAS